MLIEFRVENHRSLREEQALSMVAGALGDPADPRLRMIRGHAEALLPVAALYGANASGKSNVLSALAFMQEAVLESHRQWAPDLGVPRSPFAWGESKTAPSIFEVTVIVRGVRYQYGFAVSDHEFLEEWLYAWPRGKKQVWFEREAGRFRFGDQLKGENKLIEEVTRPNALFLSAAVQHKHSQLATVFGWFSALRSVGVTSRSRASYTTLYRDFLDESRIASMIALKGLDVDAGAENSPIGTLIDRFRILLKGADVGIVDVAINLRISDQMRQPDGVARFYLKHLADNDDSWLPLEEESNGTRTLFRLAIPMLDALEGGSVLLVDELEASLHPVLAQHIVRQFNDPRTNPHNAQLIFTTHDTNLLGPISGAPTVRRDQVWMTEKDAEGATSLYPLTDFKPRKAENLERGYLQGRYGAIPFLGEFFGKGE